MYKAIINAWASSSKPKILDKGAKAAIMAPPGTPGAPTANIPNSTINNTIVPKGGTAPYNILETTHNEECFC